VDDIKTGSGLGRTDLNYCVKIKEGPGGGLLKCGKGSWEEVFDLCLVRMGVPTKEETFGFCLTL